MKDPKPGLDNLSVRNNERAVSETTGSDENKMTQQDSAPAMSSVLAIQSARTPADKGIRAAGYLLDVLPAVVLGLFCFIPIMGPIVAGLLLAPYWLLRDVTGSSLGKLILGTVVVHKDGQPATAASRVLRNVPLAIGPAFLIIPFLGYFLGPVVSGIAVLVETVMVLTQGERIGDRLARTTVVKKQPI